MSKTYGHAYENGYEVVEHRLRRRKLRRFHGPERSARIVHSLPVVAIPIQNPHLPVVPATSWIPPRSELPHQEFLRDIRLDLLHDLGEQALLAAQEA